MDAVLLEAVCHICEDRCQAAWGHRAELDGIAARAREELRSLSSDNRNKECLYDVHAHPQQTGV